MNTKDRESYHVRLKPSPPMLLRTTTGVGDRFDCQDLEQYADAGLYRRVSKEFITDIRKERDRNKPDTERWQRLNEIITLAESAPVIAETDLGNSLTDPLP